MTNLDRHYCEMLKCGLSTLREAVQASNSEWIYEEVELLNAASGLIGEPSVELHEYFWFRERISYIEWTTKPGKEYEASKMQAHYAAIWKAMEPEILAMIEQKL